MNAIGIYDQLHKQLTRKQRVPVIELIFFIWSYLSTSNHKRVSSSLSIKQWFKQFAIGTYDGEKIQNTFEQIEREFPRIKNILTTTFSENRKLFDDRDGVLSLYESVFSRFLLQEIKEEDWKSIFKNIVADLFERKKVITTPIDIATLAASLFSIQFNKRKHKKSNKKEVYIPVFSSGNIAVEIHDQVDYDFRFIGHEEDLLSYVIAVLNLFFNDIERGEVSYMKSEAIGVSEFLISILDQKSLDDFEIDSAHLNLLAYNSEISVVATSQAFLFAKKYSGFRRKLLLDSNLIAVISTSPSAYSTNKTKTALLIFDKKFLTDSILFINAEDEDQIIPSKKICKHVQSMLELNGFSKSIDVRDLRTDEYSLLPSKRIIKNTISDDIETIKSRLLDSEKKMMSNEYRLIDFFKKIK